MSSDFEMNQSNFGSSNGKPGMESRRGRRKLNSAVVAMNQRGVAVVLERCVIGDDASKAFMLCIHENSPVALVVTGDKCFNGVPVQMLVDSFIQAHPGPWKTFKDCEEAFLEYIAVDRLDCGFYEDSLFFETVQGCMDSVKYRMELLPLEAVERNLSVYLRAERESWIDPKELSRMLDGEDKQFIMDQIRKNFGDVEDSHKVLLHGLIYDFMVAKLSQTACEGDVGRLGAEVVICGYGMDEDKPSLAYEWLVGSVKGRMQVQCFDDSFLVKSNGVTVVAMGNRRRQFAEKNLARILTQREGAAEANMEQLEKDCSKMMWNSRTGAAESFLAKRMWRLDTLYISNEEKGET